MPSQPSSTPRRARTAPVSWRRCCSARARRRGRDIVADYTLTQATMERFLDRCGPRATASLIDAAPQTFFAAEPAAMARVLDDLERATDQSAATSGRSASSLTSSIGSKHCYSSTADAVHRCVGILRVGRGGSRHKHLLNGCQAASANTTVSALSGEHVRALDAACRTVADAVDVLGRHAIWRRPRQGVGGWRPRPRGSTLPRLSHACVVAGVERRRPLDRPAGPPAPRSSRPRRR